ncbi:DUF3320 domain-containing protein [Cellulomonas sp. APG4]|uniref:DUF3320 domain-containing protein n=1 Tax=Cellulomonas sp. APG4 TaxID=1538656 RepID=UPI001379DAC5|nr:DUF3320 domain-containing protein [Cellulomonas sp. APG4]NCT90968.1 DUF3320 domain-containing protein [Cellulomonas sp. APG4]
MTEDSTGARSDVRARLERQLETWRRELVTLDRRQRLLYFKHTKSASLEVVAPSPSNALMLTENGDVRVVLDGERTSVGGRELVIVDKTESELKAGLRRLDQHSQQTFADRGLWTLYLGLGMLAWRDPQDDKPVVSPILLAPVRLRRTSADMPYVVTRTEDDVVLNPVLALKLEHDFGLVLDDIDPDVLDVASVFAGVRAKVAAHRGWDVQERVVLTTFSFHKEAIYQDLREHQDEVLASELVQLVALGPDAPSAGSFAFDPIGDDELDTVMPPELLHNVMDADGSQRKCILAARDGRSFVMDGPPGSGKSQTIANMIAELMASGRSVLFVSEKAAALDVVRNRLSDVGLGPFLLELHSSATTRKHFAETMGKALSERIRAGQPLSAVEAKELERARNDLSGYAIALNEVRPRTGRSIHWALGTMAAAHRLSTFRLPGGAQWSSLSADDLADIRSGAGALARVWDPVERGSAFAWRGLVRCADPGDPERLRRLAVAARDSAAALASRARAVDDDLEVSMPVTAAAASDRVLLLQLLEERPDGSQLAHLTTEDLDAVRKRLADVRRLVDAHARATTTIEESVGPRWTELQPDDLELLTALEIANDLWSPSPSTSATQLRAAVDAARNAPVVLAELASEGRRLAHMLGVDAERLAVSRLADLVALARLGAQSARPEADWLNPAVTAAVHESARILGSLVELVRGWEKGTQAEFTSDALTVDLPALHTRLTQTHVGLRRWSSAARADRRLLKSITVRGRADKQAVAALPNAISWQQAEAALTRAEADHAARLGGYYRRTDTDFSRVSVAIATAEQALRLVGDDLDADALARQLSATGNPDPQLLGTADRIEVALSRWHSLAAAWGETNRPEAPRTPQDIAEAAQQLDESYRAAVTVLERVAVAAGRDTTIADARSILTAVGDHARTTATILDRYEDDRAALGPAYESFSTEWPAVERALGWASAVRGRVNDQIPLWVAERLWEPTIRSVELAPLVETYSRQVHDLLSNFDEARRAELRADLDTDLDIAHEVLAELAADAPRDVPVWAEYRNRVQQFEDFGCAPLIEELTSARAAAADVPEAVERAVLEAWVDATINADHRLKPLRADDRNALVERFHHLDRRLVHEAHNKVVVACNARRPKSATSRGAQLIQRQANLKSRHKPIRTVLADAGQVAQELKPCFMMSPLAVSQYLPAGMRFDVVIFDEASQVLPSDAVNCIYRAKQLIVAGDVKQLPPTSFFTSGLQDEETDDEEEPDVFQSVLDQCKAAGALPSLPLSWHYRSAHESLIAFSNHRFYKGELFTFPSAREQGSDIGLESIVVNGTYRRGTSRDNPVEAQKVVERIVHHATEHPDLSLGVVTFSTAQEDAIFAEMERQALEHPVISDLLNSHDRLDGFFIKSLESVQGDERDIILFSIGYGPDEHGKMTTNFGPLNRQGGWRRLNVAITRARQRVEVVSSFHPGQLVSVNEGVSALARYIDFAQRGMPALAVDLTDSLGDAESPFEEDVIREIVALGYEAVPQVGTAGYRIDIGIRHPLEPGRFILGVECDGAAYHSSRVARDRDRLREEVLTRLGWRIHRIWGISWVRERAEQLDRLRAAIEAAVSATGMPAILTRPTTPVLEVEQVDLDAPPEWGRPYRVGGERYRTWHEPGAVEARPAMRQYFAELLAVEAPMHLSVAFDRLRRDWGIGRIGSQIDGNARRAIEGVRVRDSKVVIDSMDFITLPGEAFRVPRYPSGPESQRKPRQVPPEEIRVAITHIVDDAVVAESDQIARDVAKFFGWNTTEEVRRMANQAVARLVHERRLENRGDSFRIAHAST